MEFTTFEGKLMQEEALTSLPYLAHIASFAGQA